MNRTKAVTGTGTGTGTGSVEYHLLQPLHTLNERCAFDCLTARHCLLMATAELSTRTSSPSASLTVLCHPSRVCERNLKAAFHMGATLHLYLSRSRSRSLSLCLFLCLSG